MCQPSEDEEDVEETEEDIWERRYAELYSALWVERPDYFDATEFTEDDHLRAVVECKQDVEYAFRYRESEIPERHSPQNRTWWHRVREWCCID